MKGFHDEDHTSPENMITMSFSSWILASRSKASALMALPTT